MDCQNQNGFSLLFLMSVLRKQNTVAASEVSIFPAAMGVFS
jgi:hypothetical protein